MIYKTIIFRRPGLVDEFADQGDDAPTGRSCAIWLSTSLRSFACDGFDEAPIEEDWGYAVRVQVQLDTLLIGCANAFEEDANIWRVMIADNFLRGVLPGTRARKEASLARLSDHIEQFLRADAEVSNIEVELGA